MLRHEVDILAPVDDGTGGQADGWGRGSVPGAGVSNGRTIDQLFSAIFAPDTHTHTYTRPADPVTRLVEQEERLTAFPHTHQSVGGSAVGAGGEGKERGVESRVPHHTYDPRRL